VPLGFDASHYYNTYINEHNATFPYSNGHLFEISVKNYIPTCKPMSTWTKSMYGHVKKDTGRKMSHWTWWEAASPNLAPSSFTGTEPFGTTLDCFAVISLVAPYV